MATKIFEKKTITLDSGVKIVAKPLKIKNLRVFMDKMKEMEKLKKEDDGFDILIQAADIAVRACNSDLPEDFDIEEELDMPLVYEVVNIAGGIDMLGDSNLTPRTA